MFQRLSFLLLLGLLTVSCAAGGSKSNAELEKQLAASGIHPESRPTRVSLRDHRSGTTIGLLNESHTEKATFYSTTQRAPSYKVVPDLDMGALVTQLEELGFQQQSSAGSSRVPGARVTIQLDQGGSVRTLAYTTRSPQEKVQLVQDCGTAIRALYNHHQAYQLVENTQGGVYFEEEAARLRQQRQN